MEPSFSGTDVGAEFGPQARPSASSALNGHCNEVQAHAVPPSLPLPQPAQFYGSNPNERASAAANTTSSKRVSRPDAPQQRQDPTAWQREKNRAEATLASNLCIELTDREKRSTQFRSLKKDDVVIIQRNNKAGHHDVTGRQGHLEGKEAVIVEPAKWPNTWVEVRVNLNGQEKCLKVRTSNIKLKTDVLGEVLKQKRHKVASYAQSLMRPGDVFVINKSTQTPKYNEIGFDKKGTVLTGKASRFKPAICLASIPPPQPISTSPPPPQPEPAPSRAKAANSGGNSANLQPRHKQHDPHQQQQHDHHQQQAIMVQRAEAVGRQIPGVVLPPSLGSSLGSVVVTAAVKTNGKRRKTSSPGDSASAMQAATAATAAAAASAHGHQRLPDLADRNPLLATPTQKSNKRRRTQRDDQQPPPSTNAAAAQEDTEGGAQDAASKRKRGRPKSSYKPTGRPRGRPPKNKNPAKEGKGTAARSRKFRCDVADCSAEFSSMMEKGAHMRSHRLG